MKDEWFKDDCKCISSRLLAAKFMHDRFKMPVLVAYELCSDKRRGS